MSHWDVPQSPTPLSIIREWNAHDCANYCALVSNRTASVKISLIGASHNPYPESVGAWGDSAWVRVGISDPLVFDAHLS